MLKTDEEFQMAVQKMAGMRRGFQMTTCRIAPVLGSLLLALLAMSVGAEDAAQPAAPAPNPDPAGAGAAAAPVKQGNPGGIGIVLSKLVPVECILDHKADLTLTADQEKRITDLRDKFRAAIEKLTTDEEFQAEFQKLLGACKAPDKPVRKGGGKGGAKGAGKAADNTDPEAALQQAAGLLSELQQVADLFCKKTALDLKTMRDQVVQSLTPEQMAKLQELLKPSPKPSPAPGKGKGKRNPPAPDGGGAPLYGG